MQYNLFCFFWVKNVPYLSVRYVIVNAGAIIFIATVAVWAFLQYLYTIVV